ncbi:Delta(14)-sterol reductase [Malassezia cuniculi]|uniref:Delta(14)-sterol reductase n=1 Tax=Malassezia cuniculi TaxID=948313 RepID=A0AAF0J5J3_9BASI|nr:Delta(14)-sterol reductase [Malassezia cuniculi]
MTATATSLLAPRTHEYEFGGPLGALFVSITVPCTMYYFVFGCNEQLGCALTLPVTDWDGFAAAARDTIVTGFTDKAAWFIYYGWYAYTVFAWLILPGKWVPGLPLRTGGQLQYKINALPTAFYALGVVAAIIYNYGPRAMATLYVHWPGLLSAALTNAVLQAIYVYVASFRPNKLLALGGNSGNVIYDWFIGRELNPRIGLFDIKTFNELRPGLILWILLDISCLCYQYVRHGFVSDSMIVVVLCHTWYVLDSLVNEPIIFSQMDITTDGFGFMLSVGDLAWVPFTYSLQARYLAFEPVHLGFLGILGVVVVQLVGYYIFRVANNEKNEFRKGNNPKSMYQCADETFVT